MRLMLLTAFFEGLVKLDAEGKVQLAMAESVEILNKGLTYVFYLKDSKWSDNTVVTSYDFLRSWQSSLQADFPADYAEFLFPIKNAKKIKEGQLKSEELGVETPDSSTLIIHLEQANQCFLSLASLPIFFPVPRGLLDAEIDRWQPNSEFFVHNGAFQVESWSPQYELILSKNIHYWNAANVTEHKIEFTMVDAVTELALFEQGKLDLAGSPLSTISFNSMEAYQNSSEMHVKPALGTEFVRINTHKPILDNVFFRKALFAALDRKEICEYITLGTQEPAHFFVPSILDKERELPSDEFSPEVAQKYFQKALEDLSLSFNELPKMTMLHGTDSRRSRVAQVMQEQWRKVLGLEIQLQAMEGRVLFPRVRGLDYDFYLGSWIGDYPDAGNFLELFVRENGPSNNTGWESLEYTDLLQRANQAENLGERVQLLRQADSLLVDQAPIIPVYFYRFVSLSSGSFEDVPVSPTGHIALTDLQKKPFLEDKSS